MSDQVLSNNQVLSDDDVKKLRDLAAVLIPATATMPAAPDVAGYDGLLRIAAKACAYTTAELRAVLDGIPAPVDFGIAKAWSAADRTRFDMAGVIVSGAYYMAPAVLEKLGYPAERRHPAGPEEFLDEYETGVVDAVTARGQVWRDPRKTG